MTTFVTHKPFNTIHRSDNCTNVSETISKTFSDYSSTLNRKRETRLGTAMRYPRSFEEMKRKIAERSLLLFFHPCKPFQEKSLERLCQFLHRREVIGEEGQGVPLTP